MTLTEVFNVLRPVPLVDLFFLVGLPLYWVSLIPFFAIRCALWGMPHSERVDKLNSKVIPRFITEYGYWMLQTQVSLLLKLGITADMMTGLSLLTAAGGAVYLAMGRFGLGGSLMFCSFFCDAYDGIIARATHTSSDRG